MSNNYTLTIKNGICSSDRITTVFYLAKECLSEFGIDIETKSSSEHYSYPVNVNYTCLTDAKVEISIDVPLTRIQREILVNYLKGLLETNNVTLIEIPTE